VPIHNAAKDLDACLESVVRHAPSGAEVLLIDDASDQSRVGEVIARWVARPGPRWTVLRNEHNLGFVATANIGIGRFERDVVLLNSDTLVTAGWLEGLRDCLASDASIATATPWTNNGEIASLPGFCRNNRVPRDIDAVARIVRRCGGREYPELPTAVGFCMAVSRTSIERIGRFDEQAFGLGYGEENDFSRRAVAAGMRNVLCTDVYVAHVGGRSFRPRGLRPDEAAMQRLTAKHPDYPTIVGEFIDADPLGGVRARIIDAVSAAGVSFG
jgi:GT2 family glycosyltransferase